MTANLPMSVWKQDSTKDSAAAACCGSALSDQTERLCRLSTEEMQMHCWDVAAD